MRSSPSGSTDSHHSILDFSEQDVHVFLAQLGFPQYESQLIEHGISGDILASLDHDGLKDLGIQSVGQRLSILKAVYNLKVKDGVPIEPEHYVPPSELVDSEEPLTLSKIREQLQAQERRILALEEENRKLQESMQRCLDEVMNSSPSQQQVKDKRELTDRPINGGSSSLKKQHSFKWKEFKSTAKSPTRTTYEQPSPTNSPRTTEYDVSQTTINKDEKTPRSYNGKENTNTTTSATPPPPTATKSSTRVADAADMRNFKVTLDDPAWKVLPAALKKYKINNDDWQNYAMFICYGNTERCLSYDEKPLLLFQKLKDAKRNPVFMLKHIRDIRSPIAVAQQKQAARNKDKDKTSQGQDNRSLIAPPITVSKPGTNGRTPTSTTNTTNGGLGGWGDGITSPSVEPSSAGGAESGGRNLIQSIDPTHGGAAQPLTTVSYAIAIYPYHAEQEDEFDVAVNDTFIILCRARGWWVVQRDPTGTGQLDADQSKQGWVPAGCLLETSQPVESAIQEAIAARADTAEAVFDSTPILPSSIVSTSYPGIALMDYRKKGGEEELDLVKDDMLRVFKRYNHWSYAVKESDGERGWVPSWFIGKITSTNPPASKDHLQSNQAPVSALESTELRYAQEPTGTSPISPGFSLPTAPPGTGRPPVAMI